VDVSAYLAHAARDRRRRHLAVPHRQGDGAALKARSYVNETYEGLMYPWESAFTGDEVTPIWAATGALEQHITGDIASPCVSIGTHERHRVA